MKRGLVIGGSAIGVIIVVVIAVVVIGLSNIDSIIKEGVETQGSEITQAKVSLKEVEISATDGSGRLAGLVIGNPKGFKTEHAFSLGGIKISLDVGTVMEDKVVIREITIDAPQIIYELGDGGSNLDALKRNVNSYLGVDEKSGKAPAGDKPAATKDDGGKKLIIEHIYIRGGKISVSASMLQGRKITSPLPDLHLKDIGKKEGGASPGEVVNEVITAVQDAATKSVASLNIKGLVGDVGKAVESQLKGVTDQIGSGAGAGLVAPLRRAPVKSARRSRVCSENSLNILLL
jgi:hypothetical protein